MDKPRNIPSKMPREDHPIRLGELLARERLSPGSTDIQERSRKFLQKINSYQHQVAEKFPNGIPNEPTATCETCGGMGAVTMDIRDIKDPNFGKAFPCPACAAPKIERERVNDMFGGGDKVLDHYRDLTFETFEALDPGLLSGKEHALDCCKILAENGNLYLNGRMYRGVFLWGDYGTGKTGLANSVLRTRSEFGESALFVKYRPLMKAIQDRYGKEGTSAYDVAKTAMNVKWLLIDEIGDPDYDGQETKDKRDWLLEIVDHHHSRDLPLLLTSNLDTPRFVHQFGERVCNRIFQLCYSIEVTGANLRFA